MWAKLLISKNRFLNALDMQVYIMVSAAQVNPFLSASSSSKFSVDKHAALQVTLSRHSWYSFLQMLNARRGNNIVVSCRTRPWFELSTFCSRGRSWNSSELPRRLNGMRYHFEDWWTRPFLLRTITNIAYVRILIPQTLVSLLYFLLLPSAALERLRVLLVGKTAFPLNCCQFLKINLTTRCVIVPTSICCSLKASNEFNTSQ